MQKKVSLFLLSVLLLASCIGYEGKNQITGESDYTAQAYAWADSVMQTMTLEERVGQLFMPAVYASGDDATLRKLIRYISDLHIGGVMFLKGDMNSAVFIADTIQRISSPAMWISVDAEWGLGMRFADAPVFPINSLLGDSNDQLMYEYGYEIARECRIIGVNMILGPVVDVASDDESVMKNRSFGEDPEKVAMLAVAYARGVEDGSVISVAKHFPGHGSTVADSHKTLPRIERNLLQLDSIDLLPFRKYIECGLSAIMVGHLWLKVIDNAERPASESKNVIDLLLKRKLGFNGLVITDALNMDGAALSSPLAALKAGADIILAPEDTETGIDEVLRAVDSGSFRVSDLNERCRKILFYKYKMGLNDLPELKKKLPYDSILSPVVLRLRKLLER